MVNISHKRPTRRAAAATAFVLFSNPNPYTALTNRALPKGDAIAVARIAGIQAAKKTGDLIPLAHPGLGITSVKVGIRLLKPTTTSDRLYNTDSNVGESSFEFGGVKITAYVSCDGKTGVEMEALTAANMAALTIYDMCKAVDKHMLITGVRVSMKKGGKSGDWKVNGSIPNDPNPSPPPEPLFQPLLERRMEGIVVDEHDPIPSQLPTYPSKVNDNSGDDSTVAPPPTPSFFSTATTELNLFIANTTSPATAAAIAALRARHKALTARIREAQRRIELGYPLHDLKEDGTGGAGAEWIRDGRVDYDILARLHAERREIAARVMGWRITGGSEIGEPTGAEEVDGSWSGYGDGGGGGGEGGGGGSGTLFEQRKREFERQAGAAGEWRWEGGVYGVWRADPGGDLEVDGGQEGRGDGGLESKEEE